MDSSHRWYVVVEEREVGSRTSNCRQILDEVVCGRKVEEGGGVKGGRGGGTRRGREKGREKVGVKVIINM